ncbi:DUF4391 domain-containing protein [Deinococcus aestuarii]|uniref:DUF4391 domain-containing protein n=1 Tax=Deinococcus aestuarii TaxID=2774531 RepID=UPI001C0E6423|nr:DUF4391 domain-containing protein [Deinococcus aestuarii]
MSADSPSQRVLAALNLPPTAEVGQRIPKKLLLEHGTPTAADRRLIEAHVAELRWEASLKPQTVAIPGYSSETQTYTELAVLTLTLRETGLGTGKSGRLAELVHRAIPYPLLLLSVAPEARSVAVSVSHKRHSQAAEGQVVLEHAPVSVLLGSVPSPHDPVYLTHLGLGGHPTPHLYALYDLWVRAGLAHAGARISGRYQLSEDSVALRSRLAEHARLEREIAGLRAEARREKQLGRRVELNLRLRTLEIEKARLTF